MTKLVLHHFLYSHYNEKARWALEFKRIQHQRRTMIPGLHARPMKKLAGKTSTPALVIDGTAVSGSAALIDRLEAMYPEPALYPQAETLRDKALDWQQRADAELGPAARSIVWGVLIDNPAYTARVFGRDLNPLFRYVYGHMLSGARDQIVKMNKVSAADVEQARELVSAWLIEVENAVSQTGYLAGASFSVADLTVASLLSPFLLLNHQDMRRPEPYPAALTELLDEYASNPAIQWAREMFDRHRPNT